MYEQPDQEEYVLISGAETNAAYGVVICTIPPFSPTPAPHRHRAHLESCVVMDGALAYTSEGETVVLSAGQHLLVQPGQRHTCWNPSAAPARLLLIFAPGGSAEELLQLARGAPGSAVAGWDTS